VSIIISPPQQAILDRLLRQHSTPQALVRRIQIIVAAAAGVPNEQIAQQVACSPKTVRRWRARWAAAQPDLAAVEADGRALRTLIAEVLADAPRPGAPQPSRPNKSSTSSPSPVPLQPLPDAPSMPGLHVSWPMRPKNARLSLRSQPVRSGAS
jgi:hypothetical protein